MGRAFIIPNNRYMVMTMILCISVWMSSIRLYDRCISRTYRVYVRVSSHLEIRHEPCFGRDLSGVRWQRKGKKRWWGQVFVCVPPKRDRSEFYIILTYLGPSTTCCRFSFILFIQPHSQWFLTLRSKSLLISMELFPSMVKALYTVLFTLLYTKHALRST